LLQSCCQGYSTSSTASGIVLYVKDVELGEAPEGVIEVC